MSSPSVLARDALFLALMAAHANNQTPFSPDRTIALVGMMGVGKTTVGRRLAPKLGLPFFDADEEIEKAAGMSVADLFTEHGEESFRRGEAQVIERLVSGPPIVLATGGGALTSDATRALLKEQTLTVWLKSDVDTIVKRATRRGTRPLLMKGDARATIVRLLEERAPLYGQADIAIESQHGPHSKTVAAIIDALMVHKKAGKDQH
ncbi:MAG: shikimate kinase [Pseudomonadota bacterium]